MYFRIEKEWKNSALKLRFLFYLTLKIFNFKYYTFFPGFLYGNLESTFLYVEKILFVVTEQNKNKKHQSFIMLNIACEFSDEVLFLLC